MLPSGDLPEHTEAFPDTTSHNTTSPFCDYDDDDNHDDDDDDVDADDDADDEVHAGLFWLSTTVCYPQHTCTNMPTQAFERTHLYVPLVKSALMLPP